MTYIQPVFGEAGTAAGLVSGPTGICSAVDLPVREFSQAVDQHSSSVLGCYSYVLCSTGLDSSARRLGEWRGAEKLPEHSFKGVKWQ